jgi:transposase
MIPVPSGVRVWLAVGRTDMRRGMNGLRVLMNALLPSITSHRRPVEDARWAVMGRYRTVGC